MINFKSIKQAADQLWDNGEIYTRPFHFGASHWDIRPSERDAKQIANINDPTERRAAIEQLVHNSIDRLQRERANNMKNKIGFTLAGAYVGGPVGAIVGHSIDKNRVPSKRVLNKREAKYNELMKDRYPEDRVKYQAAVEAAVDRLRMSNKSAAENPYDTYEKLLKYHSTGPDEGMTPQESADTHLNYELMNALMRQVAKGKGFRELPKSNFSIGGEVPKAGYKTPLRKRIDSYMKHFMKSYDAPIEGIGSNREMNFGPDGKPTYIHDFDTGAFMFHPSVVTKGLNDKQKLALLKKLRNESVFRLGLVK